MMADHMLAMPFCEGVRRFMSLVFGMQQHDLENQRLIDRQLIINHYLTAINYGRCDICWERGARFENPTCRTSHAVCSHCISRVKKKCPMCREPYYTRLQILPPDCERTLFTYLAPYL